MIQISAAKIKGICPTVLLSLTLLLGFISTPFLNFNQERQSPLTELVLRPTPSRRRIVVYQILKKHLPFLFFLSSQEIVRRLLLYDRKVMVDHSENLKPETLAITLRVQLLAIAVSNSKSSDSYILRG